MQHVCQSAGHGLPKPLQRFFHDRVLGIPKAGSLILARIAGQLEEESDLRHTHKRLDYHLHSDRWDEHAVQEQALQVALEEVPWKPETVIRGDSLEMGSGFYEAPKPG